MSRTIEQDHKSDRPIGVAVEARREVADMTGDRLAGPATTERRRLGQFLGTLGGLVRGRRAAYVAGLLLVLATAVWWYGRETAVEHNWVLYTVTRGDLPVTVTERGRIESQNVLELKCEVENMPGEQGVRIIYIVPNGKKVKKGELLVEFDSTPVQEALDNAYVEYQRARAQKIAAEAEYENRLIQNQIELEMAKLELEKAELQLKQFEDETGGTFAIDLQQAELAVQEARNQLVEAQAALLLAKTRLEGIRMLYRLGYRGKGDLDQAMFDYLRAEDQLVRATNAVRTAEINVKRLRQYDYPLNKLELTAAVENARRKLQQVQKENEAELQRLKADKEAAEREFAKAEERLRRYEKNLERCKIYAPVDGVAIYPSERTPWGRFVGEGERVHERFTVITMPDLKHMQVKVQIHEAVLDKVREGLPATITVDALPGEVFTGKVKSVAKMPSKDRQWYERDVNKYDTIVTIDGEVEGLNPGMTASVEIVVDRLEDVLSVPIQAVIDVGGVSWCFVAQPSGAVERRRVEVGVSNDKFVQIVKGLEEGEQVVLNPRDLPPDLLPSEQEGQGASVGLVASAQ